jgi:hypothetical protein
VPSVIHNLNFTLSQLILSKILASYFKRPLIIKKRIQNAYSQSMTRDAGNFGVCLPQSFANFDIPIS